MSYEQSALEAVNPKMMQIVTVRAVDYPAIVCATEFKKTSAGGEQEEDVVAIVRAIDSKITGGVLPSRCWIGEDGELRMMFYVSDAISPSARLFGDHPMYCMMIDVADGEVLSYPLGLNVLVDQVIDAGKCKYVILFNQENYVTVVVSDVKPGEK